MPVEALKPNLMEEADADLKDPALLKLRDLIYRISGIYHQEAKFYLLSTGARRRMQVLKSPNFVDYLDHLTTRPNRDVEMRNLLNEITIGETYFFRSPGQIEALTKIIFPKMLALPGKQGLKKLRIWSAGCSTGEEPYSLSIILMEYLTEKAKDWTFEIHATDLNENSITKCKEGVYAEYAVRNLTPLQRQKYFVSEGNNHRLNDVPRTNVKF